jgi:hypothetical protein
MMEEDPIIIRMNIAHFEAMLRHVMDNDTSWITKSARSSTCCSRGPAGFGAGDGFEKQR